MPAGENQPCGGLPFWLLQRDCGREIGREGEGEEAREEEEGRDCG